MSFDWEGTVAAVPEPGTVVLLSSCLIAFGVARSKRKS
jgi:PEP-CTERM motif-containing protein